MRESIREEFRKKREFKKISSMYSLQRSRITCDEKMRKSEPDRKKRPGNLKKNYLKNRKRRIQKGFRKRKPEKLIVKLVKPLANSGKTPQQ